MSGGETTVRRARAKDWPRMREIFLAGIATGQASFETPDSVPEDWDSWVRHKHADSIHLISDREEAILAWGGLAPTSHRACYRGVAEVQLYVTPARQGKGLGGRMLATLVEYAERNGFWTLQAIVFPENRASLGLFLGAGFRQVGYREAIARMNGQWRDTILLERRSRELF